MRKEIAHAMGINVETVKNHLSRARYKLGARNTAHAVTLALRRGII
jgi:DNA-binding CsgD family transcriptional regulator